MDEMIKVDSLVREYLNIPDDIECAAEYCREHGLDYNEEFLKAYKDMKFQKWFGGNRKNE